MPDKHISIRPITRLEGHGNIEIFLDNEGNVERAFLQVPELRGFEKFSEGRPAEEMPRITPKICGVCPTAHHMASQKALDDLYNVNPPLPAKKIRELMYSAFMIEDHAIHFYFLGGPDFVVGPDAPKSERNILGVIDKVGLEAGKVVIKNRKQCREIITALGGRVIHPVSGLPGGVSKGIAEEDLEKFKQYTDEAVEFGQFTVQLFKDIVLKNEEYVKLITSDPYTHKTYYMGLVDENNHVNFYDGKIRVVNPEGKEFVKFDGRDYKKHISEHVEKWSYIKFPFLKNVGWKGFVDGQDSGVYRVAPLARLNASDGLATPLAQKEYEFMYETLGGKPVHHTLAFHWARVIELLYAAERLQELINDDDILNPDIRTIPDSIPNEGIGIVEAPRGVLIHDYATDEQGIMKKANLLVATVHNSAPIAMSIEKAAKGIIKNFQVNDGLLNMVEMAFRAYDPCLACATHSLPGNMPLRIKIFKSDHTVHDVIERM
ncbi:MAG: Ni/Fe hydrogenase subunit alpha [Candidatus Aminicenantes bacterium]|nr:Ni/Fe hydrogenase subunit alpha [Candidatus Aminicenantes bacterium]